MVWETGANRIVILTTLQSSAKVRSMCISWLTATGGYTYPAFCPSPYVRLWSHNGDPGCQSLLKGQLVNHDGVLDQHPFESRIVSRSHSMYWQRFVCSECFLFLLASVNRGVYPRLVLQHPSWLSVTWGIAMLRVHESLCMRQQQMDN